MQGAGAPVEVVDPEEPKAVQKQREKLQELRIGLLRAAQRFGMGYQSEVVGSYMAVLDRLEKISRPMAKRRVDVGRLALEEAQVGSTAIGVHAGSCSCDVANNTVRLVLPQTRCQH